MRNLKKLVLTLFCITAFCFVTGFVHYSDLKQDDESSCAPVCAANCAINILNQDLPPETLIHNFAKLAKTDKNGTTAQNLCSALDTFFNKSRLKTVIKYYGIRKTDRKYKSRKHINICNELESGRAIILNIGFYKFEKGRYKRQYGHYVNAYQCKENKILIADPYSKNAPRYIEIQKAEKIKITNTKDDEQYSRRRFVYYEISPAFEYQESDEKALINGIISIYPLYL